MRLKLYSSDRDNGLYRWDEGNDPDPTKVCFTCGYFNINSNMCCNTKRVIRNFLNIETKNRIRDPKNVRCGGYSLDHEIKYIKKNGSIFSIDELKEKIRNLRVELGTLENLLEKQEIYGALLKSNPFEGEDAKQVRDKLAKEIDILIDYKNFYKDTRPFNYIDDIDLSSFKVFKETIWLSGKKRLERLRTINTPLHHSLLNIKKEKHVIKFTRKMVVTITRNGEDIITNGHGFATIARNPSLINTCFKINHEMNDIAEKIYKIIIKMYKPRHYHYQLIGYLLDNDNFFNDFSTFRKKFPILDRNYKKESYRNGKFNIFMWYENGKYKFKLETENIFYMKDFVEFMERFKNSFDETSINAEFIIDDVEKQMIEEYHEYEKSLQVKSS